MFLFCLPSIVLFDFCYDIKLPRNTQKKKSIDLFQCKEFHKSWGFCGFLFFCFVSWVFLFCFVLFSFCLVFVCLFFVCLFVCLFFCFVFWGFFFGGGGGRYWGQLSPFRSVSISLSLFFPLCFVINSVKARDFQTGVPGSFPAPFLTGCRGCVVSVAWD